MNCHEKNTTVQVELLERECVICEPKLAETLEVLDVCEENLTDDCQTDTLARTWRKICNTRSPVVVIQSDISVADLGKYLEFSVRSTSVL